MEIFGGLWRSFKVVLVVFFFMEVSGSLWRSLEVFGGPWRFFEVFVGVWRSLVKICYMQLAFDFTRIP